MKKWILALVVVEFLVGTGLAVAHEGESHGEALEHGGEPLQTVTGEVVDLACYLSEGLSGPDHQACAQKCIASGLPVGIKSEERLYLVIGSEHGPANETLAPLAAKNVTAEGTITERDGVHLLAVKKLTVNE